MIQFVLPALAGFAGRMLGKSGAEAEASEKIDAIKELVGLTPTQAQAVDAIKVQPIEEVRVRRTLGIGPLAPLPANASQKAQDIRNARISAAQGTATPLDPAMKAEIDKKVSEFVSNLR